MGLFLRIETTSNILGSKDKNVIYISLSDVNTVKSDGHGGSTVLYNNHSTELRVPNLNPDSLLSDCVMDLTP